MAKESGKYALLSDVPVKESSRGDLLKFNAYAKVLARATEQPRTPLHSLRPELAIRIHADQRRCVRWHLPSISCEEHRCRNNLAVSVPTLGEPVLALDRRPYLLGIGVPGSVTSRGEYKKGQ